MSSIGGGSYTQLANFNSLVDGLLISVGCPTPVPTDPPTAAPTETPLETLQGETATPIVTPPPTTTPFESFEGATAVAASPTPPHTSTDGRPDSGTGSPLVLLLICTAFSLIGLLAVQATEEIYRALRGGRLGRQHDNH
jgi:hypothetical protein